MKQMRLKYLFGIVCFVGLVAVDSSAEVVDISWPGSKVVFRFVALLPMGPSSTASFNEHNGLMVYPDGLRFPGKWIAQGQITLAPFTPRPNSELQRYGEGSDYPYYWNQASDHRSSIVTTINGRTFFLFSSGQVIESPIRLPAPVDPSTLYSWISDSGEYHLLTFSDKNTGIARTLVATRDGRLFDAGAILLEQSGNTATDVAFEGDSLIITNGDQVLELSQKKTLLADARAFDEQGNLTTSGKIQSQLKGKKFLSFFSKNRESGSAIRAFSCQALFGNL
jgi:hypothetical protein